MFVVDANVLLHAVNSSSPEHEQSRSWLDAALGGGEPVGFAWMVLLAFLRIATHASIMPAPLSIEQATDQMNDWLSAPGAIVLDPTSRHASVLTGLMRESRSPGNLVNDAHLAALAVEHGARIVSHDHDFHRFCGVRHQLPW